MKNHTSFYEKQHVVLWKTTRRFMRNYSSDFHKSRWYVQYPKEINPLIFSTFNPTPPYNVPNITVFHWYSAPYRKTVTLVTAKNQHRCWKVRAAHTRARVLPSLLTSLFPFTWVTTWLSYHFRAVLTVEGSITEFFENTLSLFCDFFTRSAILNPYIIGG